MTAGSDDFRPRRELGLPHDTADIAGNTPPDLNFNAIVQAATAPRADQTRFRQALSPELSETVRLVPADASPLRAGRMVARDFEATGLSPRERLRARLVDFNNNSTNRFADRLTLSRQLFKALKYVRELAENAKRPNQFARVGESESERQQAERAKNKEIKTAELAKKAKAMIALVKSNPDAVAKLASIIDSPQGQSIPDVFASIIVDKSSGADGQIATNVAMQLAGRNPEFASKLGQAILQQVQTETVGADSTMVVENQIQHLAQVLTQPENRILLDSILQTNPQIRELINNQPVVPDTTLASSNSREIQLASLDLGSGLVLEMGQAKSFDVSSYTFSPELSQQLEPLKSLVASAKPQDAYTASTFDTSIPDAPLRNAVQAEVYFNPNASIDQVRESLVAKLGINQASKFTIEVQNMGAERVLALVPTPALIQERPELAQAKVPVVSETEIQTTKVEVQKLQKFISDINASNEVNSAAKFAEFARSSTNSLNTVLAFRQTIMSMSKGSNLTGRELATKIKDELNLNLSGSSNFIVEGEANSIILNAIAGDSTFKHKLVEVSIEEAPAGSLTSAQIEHIKTQVVASLGDPFKLSMLEQKLLQNGVMQSDIDSLKNAALESGNIEQVIEMQASQRIRKDMQSLVSYDRNERIVAAEDLRSNNINVLSAAEGGLGFAIEKIDSHTSVSVMIPGQAAGEEPIAVEMFRYGLSDEDNKESTNIEELTTALSQLDFQTIPVDVVDKFGRSMSVSPAALTSSDIYLQDDQQLSVEYSEDVGTTGDDVEVVDPNFNPFDYIDPSKLQQSLQLQPAENYDQYQQEQDQEFNMNDDEYVPPEYQEQIQDPNLYQDPYQGQYQEQLLPEQFQDGGADVVRPNLTALFSNDMKRRAIAASELAQNGVEVTVETSSGIFRLVAEQGIHQLTGRPIYIVRLENVSNPQDQAIIAEVQMENGTLSRVTPPAPPQINLMGARVNYRCNGQTFSVNGEELR
ncbi:MAG: hypothetical protein SFY67_04520 [Candidatus Melainabacteria bacterium]|nr:hypothetical protein [Candidatus Melainabacteria bacterium]